MPPRFDAGALRISLAVADLLDRQLLRSLGFGQRGGFERLWLGQAIHSRYQESARREDPAYEAEVVLRLELEHRGWRAEISGRLDGLRSEGTHLVVEELKSIRDLDRVSATLREIYSSQARLYAWMLHRQRGVPVQCELVWIEIGSGAVVREPLELDLEAVEREALARIDSWVDEYVAGELERQARREAGADLAFPHPVLRPGQQEILDAVATAVDTGEHLLVEAPTGLGKTVAALYPSLRHALARDRRVLVVTAKNLQQEMALQVLGLLAEEGSFRALRLRAKARMCANDEVLCHEEYCPYARDYYAKLAASGLVPRLLEGPGLLLPEATFEAARAAEVCPFEVNLELVSGSQVVVGDYNYAFDPWVAIREFRDPAALAEWIVIVDEAHNLVDRGRGYYSPELSAAGARRAAERLGQTGDPAALALADLALTLARLIEGHVEAALAEIPGRFAAVEAPLPAEALWALRPRFDEAFVEHLEYRRETRSFRADDPFVELYFGLLRFQEVLQMAGGPEFSQLARRDGDEHRLGILCKDASRFLGRVFAGAHAVIGLSATLSPDGFYRDLLGLDQDRFRSLRLPSPFPPERRRIVIDPSVGTSWREREDNYQPIAERIADFAEVVSGNCMVLFPSYGFLDAVASRLPSRRRRVLTQSRQDDERTRQAILDQLRGSLLGDILLLAVAGGAFAEGVDYPGDMLRAVAVVGPCLPAVSLERNLLRAYYDERYERGFEYAFVVPGMTRVVQAAGRLIRSGEDEGVITLLDHRFLRSPYREHLPVHWLDDGDARSLAGDPVRIAAAFFERRAPGAGP